MKISVKVLLILLIVILLGKGLNSFILVWCGKDDVIFIEIRFYKNKLIIIFKIDSIEI